MRVNPSNSDHLNRAMPQISGDLAWSVLGPGICGDRDETCLEQGVNVLPMKLKW